MSNEIKAFELVVDTQSGLTRLDKLLCLHLRELTRTKLTSLIEKGSVTVNGIAVSKSYKTKTGDVVRVFIPEPEKIDSEAEQIPLDIVFEDDDVIVINKPKGMVVHPAHGNYTGTLVNALLYHCGSSLSGINGVIRPGIVHRIDKNTSGLIVAAKNDKAHNSLAIQFKEHTVEREYRAIVFGSLKEDSGIIDKAIGRHPSNRKMMSCNAVRAKRAVTHYEVITRYNGFTYVSCRLETGRTHQIRVHMSDIGHFVIGDEVYGRKIPKIKLDFKGQCLHAKTLGFVHPSTGELMRFDSVLPPYFVSLLNKIENL